MNHPLPGDTLRMLPGLLTTTRDGFDGKQRAMCVSRKFKATVCNPTLLPPPRIETMLFTA